MTVDNPQTESRDPLILDKFVSRNTEPPLLRGNGIVVFQGGVAKNKVLVRAFKDLLTKNGLQSDRLVVPEWPELKIAEGVPTGRCEYCRGAVYRSSGPANRVGSP